MGENLEAQRKGCTVTSINVPFQREEAEVETLDDDGGSESRFSTFLASSELDLYRPRFQHL